MKDTMNTSDNIIRRAIDGVAPAEGAKERMKKNIYEKAQKAQKQEKKSVSSVRFWKIAMPVAACLCIAVIGAVKLIPTMGQNDPGKITISDNSEDNMQIASPFEEVSSAKVFEDRLGIQADAPKGAKNVAYNIISGNVAQVDFELGGHEYMLRASKSDEDLSGLYGDDKGTKKYDDAFNTQLKTIVIDGKDTYSLTWQKKGVFYTLVNTDGSSVSEMMSVLDVL